MRLKTSYGVIQVTETEFTRIKSLRANETAKRALVLTKTILGGVVVYCGPRVEDGTEIGTGAQAKNRGGGGR